MINHHPDFERISYREEEEKNRLKMNDEIKVVLKTYSRFYFL